jgi:hypothetical protein
MEKRMSKYVTTTINVLQLGELQAQLNAQADALLKQFPEARLVETQTFLYPVPAGGVGFIAIRTFDLAPAAPEPKRRRRRPKAYAEPEIVLVPSTDSNNLTTEEPSNED